MLMDRVVLEMQACSKAIVFYFAKTTFIDHTLTKYYQLLKKEPQKSYLSYPIPSVLFDLYYAGGRISGGSGLMCTDLMVIITLETGLGTILELKLNGDKLITFH